MVSLEKICLDTIVKNFKRFYFAFERANSETLQRSFEFLQKKYTFEIVSKLYEEKRLKDQYEDFFLNEHLKELDCAWLAEKHNINFLKKNCPTLRENILCRLPNLTKIVFLSHYCDEDVKYIVKFCPKLVEINLNQSNVTDNGVKYLYKDKSGQFPCPELRKLCIQCPRITLKGAKNIIQNLPFLEMIDYREPIPLLLHSLHKKQFLKHEELPIYNLTYLDFRFIGNIPNYADVLKICSIVCPKLKSIKNCRIYEEQQVDLFRYPCLEELDLQFLEAEPPMNLKNLLKNSGSNITSLFLKSCMMSISDLALNCPKLNCLALWETAFSDNDDLQQGFRCLTQCFLVCMQDDSSTIKAISLLLLFSPNLQCLDFLECVLSPDTKMRILKCCENGLLQKISFRNTNADVNFLKHILTCCPSLTHLKYFDINSPRSPNLKQLVDLAKTLPNKPQISFSM